jgi:hypothetical protein
MMIHFPSHITAQGIFKTLSDGRASGSNVMLEAIAADVPQEFLKLLDPDNAISAKRLNGIAGEFSLSNI